MTRAELIRLRIKFLWDFHKYIENLEDEDIYLEWTRDGIPDNPNNYTMREIAEDDEQWVEVVRVFSRLTAEYE